MQYEVLIINRQGRSETTRCFTATDMTDEEIDDLCSRLSAREMVRLGRIEQERFREIIPDGRQQTKASNDENDVQDIPLPEYQTVQDVFQDRGK